MTPDEALVLPVSPDLAVNPMAGRAKGLGICFAVFAAVYLVMFLYFIVFAGATGVALAHQPAPAGSRAAEQGPAAVVGMTMLLGGAFAGMFVLYGGAALAAAVGLLTKKKWGRSIAIIASIPLLISLPFGTALGICTLVMMLGAGARENYARLSGGQLV